MLYSAPINLFVISLPEFRAPNGRLRRLLHTVTAIMVMNFRYCERKYGNGHSFVSKMVSTTIACGLATNDFEASSKLKRWSRKLSDSLKTQNLALTNQSHNGPFARQSLSEEITEIKIMLSELLRDNQDMQLHLEESRQRTTELSQAIQDMHCDQERLRDAVPGIATSIKQLTSLLNNLNLSRQGQEKNHGPTHHLTPESQELLVPQQYASPKQRREHDCTQHPQPQINSNLNHPHGCCLQVIKAYISIHQKKSCITQLMSTC